MSNPSQKIRLYLHSGQHFDTLLTEEHLQDAEDAEELTEPEFEDLVEYKLSQKGFQFIGDAYVHPRAVAAVVPVGGD